MTRWSSMIDSVIRRAAVLTLAAVTLAAAGVPGQEGAKIRIVDPVEDAHISGSVRLRAAVEPPNAAADVLFFADGRQVCSVTRSPYECDWDAGTKIAEHQIRVVANLVAGGRAVSTVRTKRSSVAYSVEVDVVQITATVTDGHGHFVKGLPESVFHVYEDRARQSISHFSGDDSPLELVVAIDASSSMAPTVVQLKAAVKEFLAAIPERDRVTLLAFNSSIATLASRASDMAERSNAVDGLTAAGTTVLYDTIVRGIDMLGTKSGRKALVVFTDGEDEGSHVPIEEVTRRLEASDVTLFMIGLGRGRTLSPLKQIMVRLSEPSGGRALFTEKIEELKVAFHDLLEELSHQYLLGYESTNSSRDGTFRRIELVVDGHYQVRARQGYRAPSR